MVAVRLENLQQIIEIEKQQSVSKAAKALYMSQPALSGALNHLEDEVGVRLFERTPTGVVPTPEGTDILQLAKQIMECTNQILNYGKQNQDLYGEVTVLITRLTVFCIRILWWNIRNNFLKQN